MQVKALPLGPSSSQMDSHKVQKVSLSSTCLHFKFFSGNYGRDVLQAEEENDHPDCYQRKGPKPTSVMVQGHYTAHDRGNLHICDGIINAERYIQVLEQHPDNVLFRVIPVYSCRENAKPHSAHLGVRVRECGY